MPRRRAARISSGANGSSERYLLQQRRRRPRRPPPLSCSRALLASAKDLLGDLDFIEFDATGIALVPHQRLHADQVDHAPKIFCGAPGDLDRGTGRA